MTTDALVRTRTPWWHALLATDGSVAPVVLRLGLAVMMFPHGAQKLLGWWGGPGAAGTLAMFAKMGVSPFWTWVAILVEFVCPILLALGFLTRLAALGLGAEMVIAVVLTHQTHWITGPAGAGLDFHSLIWAIALALIVAGGGAGSLDHTLTHLRDEPPSSGLTTWRRARVEP